AKALLAQSGLRWREPLEPLEDAGVIARGSPAQLAFDFRRGFVEHVEMTAAAFARDAARVFAIAPIRFVTLREVAAHPEALASPHLARIAGLAAIAQGIDDAAIEALAQSPHARRLRWLAIPGNRLTARGLDAICASPNLRDLLYCECSGNGFGDPVDRYSHEGEAIITTTRTELGRELERRFGTQPWLHAPWYFGAAYPPDLEDAADAKPATSEEYASV
ncbi:MAG TPA: hypothetical protein VFD36_25345, partial [Kofleriaceae bacterium]|nr:hypothetical protein [Kofleriaceae bacterium]